MIYTNKGNGPVAEGMIRGEQVYLREAGKGVVMTDMKTKTTILHIIIVYISHRTTDTNESALT